MTSNNRNKKESEKGIKKSGGACIVCGWNKKTVEGVDLVEGAHIRPVNTGYEFDKADNIIALCPNHHTEFDAYNFYIDENSKKLVFYYDCEFNGKNVSTNIRHIQKGHLIYHRVKCQKHYK